MWTSWRRWRAPQRCSPAAVRRQRATTAGPSSTPLAVSVLAVPQPRTGGRDSVRRLAPAVGLRAPCPRRTVRRVAAVHGVTEVTPVRASHIWVRSGVRGYPVVPVDAIAVRPGGFARATGSPELARALRSGAVLSRTGAAHAAARGRVRHAAGGRPPAAGDRDGARRGDRRLRAGHGQPRPGPAPARPIPARPRPAAAGQRTPGDQRRRPLRWRAPGRRPFLRAADEVLPLGLIKRRFGEYRTAAGRDDDQAGSALGRPQHRDPPVAGARPGHAATAAIRRDLTAALAELKRRGRPGTVRVRRVLRAARLSAAQQGPVPAQLGHRLRRQRRGSTRSAAARTCARIVIR